MSEKQLKKEIFSGTVVAFIMKGLYAVSSFLLYIVISRKLGAEEAGYFFLTQTIIILSAFLVRQGFDSAIIKNVAEIRSPKIYHFFGPLATPKFY